MLATCMYMQHPDLLLQHADKTSATFFWNIWNMWNMHLKHTYISITTCTTSDILCNIDIQHLQHTSKTSDLLCNIDIQHLQHTSETSKTYYFNMRFQCSICLLLRRMEARWRGARCRGVARRSPVWSSSAAWNKVGAGGWSATVTGGASLGGGTCNGST
jgi:hypothetical protein